jgi:hypothetical protein
MHTYNRSHTRATSTLTHNLTYSTQLTNTATQIDPLSLCFKHNVCVHECARVAPALLINSLALHRVNGDDDGGLGSLGTLTRAVTAKGMTKVSAAGCYYANGRALLTAVSVPVGPLGLCPLSRHWQRTNLPGWQRRQVWASVRLSAHRWAHPLPCPRLPRRPGCIERPTINFPTRFQIRLHLSD